MLHYHQAGRSQESDKSIFGLLMQQGQQRAGLYADWIRLVTDAEGAGNWPIFYDPAPQFNVQNLLPYLKHHDAGTIM
jgi:hypothetical protein